MANRSYDDRTPDGASNPLKGEDLIGVSNEDGGGGFDLSKKITMTQVGNFFRSLFGLSIPDNIIPIGNATGDGIEASTGKAGGVVGYLTDFALAHKDFHNDTDYAFWQDSAATSGGAVYVNSPVGISLLAAGTKRLGIQAAGLEMAFSSEVIAIGFNIGGGVGAKLEVKGLGNTTSTISLLAKNNSGDIGLQVKDSAFVFLKNGVGINEFSNDGTLAGDSDESVPTEKAVKAYIDGLVSPKVSGGVFCSVPTASTVLNGTYSRLLDTTLLTSSSDGVSQNANWEIKITKTGTGTQRLIFAVNMLKVAGGGANYNFALFHTPISTGIMVMLGESEQVGIKLESGGKGRSVVLTAMVDWAENDLFTLQEEGNGTTDSMICGGGSITF